MHGRRHQNKGIAGRKAMQHMDSKRANPGRIIRLQGGGDRGEMRTNMECCGCPLCISRQAVCFLASFVPDQQDGGSIGPGAAACAIAEIGRDVAGQWGGCADDE